MMTISSNFFLDYFTFRQFFNSRLEKYLTPVPPTVGGEPRWVVGKLTVVKFGGTP
ncbi:hypothetical protein JCM16307_15870 [Thermococcus prieurii]